MSQRTARVLSAVLLMVALAVVFAIWMRARDEEQAAIRALPEPERRALFERTLTTLNTTCRRASRPTGLDDFCAEQARFILQFDACDLSCQRLASGASRRPMR
jgi:hypothetical protein